MEKFITTGVAGHVDHGKTSLVRRLTGVDTDRLKEEKKRGLSIEPSVAQMHLHSGRKVSLVDVPGHSDFLKNTIRGLSSVDTAMLVVAADDGVMPQTKDHLAILNFLNAKGGFTVLSKADTVDEETLELAELEIQDILEPSFLKGKPVIPFSVLDGRGVEEIRSAMARETETVEGKTVAGPFRLWIDQVGGFPGFGTVVCGTIFSGTIRRDDTVELSASGKAAKVRFIEAHHQRVEQAYAGQRVGLNLHGLSLGEVGIGSVIASPGAMTPTTLLNTQLMVLPKSRSPILNRSRIKLYVGACCVNALVLLMEVDRLNPGETGLAQFRLQEPLAVLPKDPFVISPTNLHTIVGGGMILEIPQLKFRAAKSRATLSSLHALQRDDLKDVVGLYAAMRPDRPITAEEIASSYGLPIGRIEVEIGSLVQSGTLMVFEGRGYFERERYTLLKRLLRQGLGEILSRDSFKMYASSEEIRFHLNPNLDDAVFARMLSDLCECGKLQEINGGYRIPHMIVKTTSRREMLIEKLEQFALRQGRASFCVGTFHNLHEQDFTYREVEQVVHHLHARKKLVRFKDGRFLSAGIMEEIKDGVRELIRRKGRLELQDAREILGYGRTRAIPLLDYLDGVGLTRRVGEFRVLCQEQRGEGDLTDGGSAIKRGGRLEEIA